MPASDYEEEREAVRKYLLLNADCLLPDTVETAEREKAAIKLARLAVTKGDTAVKSMINNLKWKQRFEQWVVQTALVEHLNKAGKPTPQSLQAHEAALSDGDSTKPGNRAGRKHLRDVALLAGVGLLEMEYPIYATKNSATPDVKSGCDLVSDELQKLIKEGSLQCQSMAAKTLTNRWEKEPLRDEAKWFLSFYLFDTQ